MVGTIKEGYTETLFNDELKEIYPERITVLFKQWDAKAKSLNFDPEEEAKQILPDPDKRCRYMLIALEWIHFHATNHVLEEKRNGSALNMIREIFFSDQYGELYRMYFSEDFFAEYQAVAVIFCENARRRIHHTVMPAMSFRPMTAFLFCVLSLTCKELNKKMEEEHGSDWWLLI